MLGRSMNTLFRAFSTKVTKVSSQEAIARTNESIKVLDKGLQKWSGIEGYAYQRDGVSIPDKPSDFLSESEHCQIKGVAKSLGVQIQNRGLGEIRKDFLEKLTELNMFEIERPSPKK